VRGVPFGVAVVAAGLYFVGLGTAPFIDPPEGLHAAVARQMAALGDWTTPRVDGVRYFDRPPLLYWLISAAFAIAGTTPAAARFWSALAAVGVAAVTARLGVMLGGARVGLLAGLMVAANLGVFLYGRIVKPDLVFLLWLTLAWAGFAIAYQGGGRLGLVLFYAALGLAAITKDILGALAPLVVVAMFFWLTGERPLRPWVPWWSVLLFAAIALPWYALAEAKNHGFLWYTLVDNHVLNFAGQRVFPDEGVPLGPIEFLVVTLLAFLPWALVLPWALLRAFRRPWESAVARLWLLFALWAVFVVGFFTASPFKLPYYGLPAFPALALLVARVWDETLDATPGSARPRALLGPLLVFFALATVALAAAWSGVVRIPPDVLASLDVATRNLAARGQSAPPLPLDAWRPLLARGALIFGLATVAMAVALWRQGAALGVGVALATTIAFLPTVAAEGMVQFVRARSVRPLAVALVERVRSGDVVLHEGAIENSASLLLLLPDGVGIVNGLQSSLAFGATFPEARDVFWGPARLQAAWAGSARLFLLSTVDPARSIVRTLPPGSVHLLAHSGGRWLYSNLPDRGAAGR
jgi:4-amino-4-deoxy-L-arabinose transferase-like glycosyltransferase